MYLLAVMLSLAAQIDTLPAGAGMREVTDKLAELKMAF
jgi:hypothetical protein